MSKGLCFGMEYFSSGPPTQGSLDKTWKKMEWQLELLSRDLMRNTALQLQSNTRPIKRLLSNNI